MQKALIQRFKDTYTGPPAWAWQFNPPIPLIGKDYKPGEGLLIYASTENLAYLNKEGTPPRFGNEDAWNRYRVVYEQEGRDSKNFFPNIGIQPVTDGGLFAAGLFVAGQCGLPQHSEPRSFLETIAVTNWCKFIIKNKTNRDYVKDL